MGPEVGERGVGEEGQKKGLWSRSSKMQRLVSPAHTVGVYLQHSTNIHSLC